MTDDPVGDDPPESGEPAGFTTHDRVLAGVLLVGVLALGLICLDVLTDGAVTRVVMGRRQINDG